MAFSEKLRSLRKKSGMSQEELAAKLNVSRQAVSKWESGGIPDIDNISKISKFFNCSIDYLINDKAEKSDSFSNSKKEKVSVKKIAVIAALLSIAVLFVLEIVALIVNADTAVYIIDGVYTPTGRFLALVEEYNLELLVHLCLAIVVASNMVDFCMDVFDATKTKNKRFVFARTIVLVLNWVGVILFYYTQLIRGAHKITESWIVILSYILLLAIAYVISGFYRKRYVER